MAMEDGAEVVRSVEDMCGRVGFDPVGIRVVPPRGTAAKEKRKRSDREATEKRKRSEREATAATQKPQKPQMPQCSHSIGVSVYRCMGVVVYQVYRCQVSALDLRSERTPCIYHT